MPNIGEDTGLLDCKGNKLSFSDNVIIGITNVKCILLWNNDRHCCVACVSNSLMSKDSDIYLDTNYCYVYFLSKEIIKHLEISKYDE